MTADLVTSALARQEEIIARGLQSFIEVGDALLVIRSERLYLEGYDTFEAYCQERWGFTARRAGQVIGAAGVVGTIVPTGLPAPTNEGQARELAKVPEPQREKVWRETLDRTGGKPTAAAVRETATQPTRAVPVAEIPEDLPDQTRPVETLRDISEHAEDSAHRAADPVRPAPWQPAPEDAEALETRREIEAARRGAQTIVSEVRARILTVLRGSRLGEKGLVTRAMVDDLRAAIDLLEGEL